MAGLDRSEMISWRVTKLWNYMTNGSGNFSSEGNSHGDRQFQLYKQWFGFVLVESLNGYINIDTVCPGHNIETLID